MRVKKYPQSHLVITGTSTKIIIDPGSITFAAGFKAEEFQGADAYLITHQHQDHMDPANIKGIVGRIQDIVYGNADVVAKLKELEIEAKETHDKEKFQVGEFEITPIDLPHCKMQDGSDGPPNTGFLINNIFFHPGDGDIAPNRLISKNLALPIAGPTITMDKALQFTKDVQAKIVIPIHYDYFKADPEAFKNMASSFDIEVRPLAFGEETEL